MKILITGSEGSLMQAVIPLLLEQGHEVTGIDMVDKNSNTKGYKFVQYDMLEDGWRQKVGLDFEGVIHAAAKIYGVGGFNARGADILGDDVTITRHVLNWAQQMEHLKRFIYISSSMVYETVEKDSLREEDTFNTREEPFIAPRTDYGLSKYVGERLCEAYAKEYDMQYIIWRPFNIITPYEMAIGKEQGVSHVFADFIREIVMKDRAVIPIFGDGKQVRCFTWIDDVARAIAKFSFDVAVPDNVAYNLGRNEPVTMIELANKIKDAYVKIKAEKSDNDDKPLGFQSKGTYPNDVQKRVPDSSDAKHLLGWVPSVSLDESVKRCVEHAYLIKKWTESMQQGQKNNDVVIDDPNIEFVDPNEPVHLNFIVKGFDK